MSQIGCEIPKLTIMSLTNECDTSGQLLSLDWIHRDARHVSKSVDIDILQPFSQTIIRSHHLIIGSNWLRLGFDLFHIPQDFRTSLHQFSNPGRRIVRMAFQPTNIIGTYVSIRPCHGNIISTDIHRLCSDILWDGEGVHQPLLRSWMETLLAFAVVTQPKCIKTALDVTLKMHINLVTINL